MVVPGRWIRHRRTFSGKLPPRKRFFCNNRTVWAKINSEDSKMEQIRNITAAEEQELWDYDNAPSKQAPCFDDQTKRIHSLQTQGLLTWENLLTPEECLALRVEIDKQMEIAKDEVICGEVTYF